jgi:hydrogenase maturation protein HypF
MVLRRARGRAPEPFALPDGFEDAPPGLAYGGQLKAALCLAKAGAALLSHHLGDLDDALTWEEYEAAERDYAALFDHRPSWLACDSHPGYRPSAAARARAAAEGLALHEIQHHHAHLASVLAETGHGRAAGPVAGIVLDGLGHGPDGTIWGGELLVGDYRDVARAAHLAPAPLPGGDAANRAPWRNLLARLDMAGRGEAADALLPDRPLKLLRQAVRAGVNAPLSSSAGRLFDAVAALLGLVVDEMSYEGEAAMRLEALARRSGDRGAYPLGEGAAIDTAPLFEALLADRAAGTAPEAMAARFHRGLAQAFAKRARAEVEAGRAGAVALSGGCFQNALLLETTVAALAGLPVLIHRRVPAGDGGLALGQAAIASARALETD